VPRRSGAAHDEQVQGTVTTTPTIHAMSPPPRAFAADRTATTESVYRYEIRLALTQAAEVMDKIFA
jgi:hypothetical protein